MADESTKTRRQPSRLQRRAPALIQVTPVGHWNVAIPLLSPLATSPDVKTNHVDNSKEECRRVVNSDNKIVSEPEKVPIVYKKWQHPAAPFYYETAPPLLQSVCTGIVDMS
ncbi:uncharacterized protein At4g14450, chloroplastic-like [Cynara cardunculus var. scolymus]|uniref:Uncharacterized protein n=1 Tax=Cynara cardunculus var. scolymus TaxID=59895 RepID=A0A103XIK4_CYNCS|nr:uncharacterized protein At4g14450, chloroplastic-like [Cynara cardunculus var. scolymus]KVH91322.1 hypothetical protein Ccrd_006657 [Cynara cardunculus var. scolymus]